MADAKAFGQRVKELRGDLSMGQAATRAGISTARWSAVETAAPQGRLGKPSIPRVPVVKAMADAIEADAVELLRLAGYDEAAAWEQARQARQQRAQPAAFSGRLNDLSPEEMGRLEAYLDGLLERRDG